MMPVMEWLKAHWRWIVVVVAGLAVISTIAAGVRACDERRRDAALGAAADAGAAAVKSETQGDTKIGLSGVAGEASKEAEQRAALAADAAVGTVEATKAALVDAGTDIDKATKDLNGVLR